MAKDSGNDDPCDKGLSFFKRAEESTRTTGTGKAPGNCKAGQKIDDYKLVKCLGRNGMGEVREALQESLKRTVALKVLLPGGGIRELNPPPRGPDEGPPGIKCPISNPA